MKRKVLSFVLIAMLAVSTVFSGITVSAAATQRYSIDFGEGFQIGTRQTDGAIAWQGGANSELGTYTVENETLKCVKSGTGGNVAMNFDGNAAFNTDNKILSLEFKIKFEDTTAGQVVYWFAFGKQMWFELSSSGSNVNLGGSIGNTSLSCAQWRKIRVDAYNTDSGSTFEFFVDDVFKGQKDYTSAVSTSANFLTIYGAGSSVFTYYMDDVKVKEYTIESYKEPYSTDCAEGFGFNKEVNGVKIVPETNANYGMWTIEDETVKITKTTGGGSNYMNVYASAIPSNIKNISVSFDVCFDVARADHPLYYYIINGPQGWFNFGGSNPLTAVLNFSGKSGNTIKDGGFPVGEWHNVRVSAHTDGTNTYYSFYIDGEFKETVTVSGDKISAITSSNYLFRIGGATGAIATARFDNFNIDFPASTGTASNFAVKYMKGEEEATEFSALQAGDSLTPVATVQSTSTDAEIDFVTVFYGAGEMISVNFQTLKASAEGEYTLSSLVVPEGATECKVMLWSEEITPLAPASVLD